jgi:hypothetical protein
VTPALHIVALVLDWLMRVRFTSARRRPEA